MGWPTRDKTGIIPISHLNKCCRILTIRRKCRPAHNTEKEQKNSNQQYTYMKFVYDMTLAEAFNLKQCVVPNPNTNPACTAQ